MSNWLIETEELARILGDGADRVVLDCSWYLPEADKHARDDFRAGHIPGARFVDLAEISDPASPYVNMLPDPALFAEVIGGLGIGNETEVVIYDAGYVSARLWWMFRFFGHDRLRILNGGWRKWRAEGRAIETGDAAPADPRTFRATPAPERVAALADVSAAIASGSVTLLDARTAARFDGHEGSGYPGVASGHMPGAINTPWALFFDAAQDYRFVTPERAAEIFASAGADLERPIITTCGSGVTAAILGFMLDALGHSGWRLYDGSWHEWGQQADTPKLIRPTT
ncbi:sulfurtransferase [Paracoccus aminophilus]|uniref:3-mercaptopyruvate sulfurtransferase n=1 Tax=Paracoccus aminophilus JCM 7686 TaxID=1367847 RepID=S5XZG5_PARAH|nr:sulfurtransferase [Paracoccus aminophilus]AGT10682.1 3-mercaptopyruvate sulfurtransferase [Paracoccus aminophilus JCM 7686]